MTTYTIVNSGGEPVRLLTITKAPVVHDGERAVEGPPPAFPSYWDGSWKDKPAKPGDWAHWDPTTHSWTDPRTFSDLKATAWATIKAARASAEFGGFVWDGSTFDSDEASQRRLQGLVQLASLNPSLSIAWTLADNTTRTLSAADALAVGEALASHVAQAFAHGQALRYQLEAATTKAAIEAVQW